MVGVVVVWASVDTRGWTTSGDNDRREGDGWPVGPGTGARWVEWIGRRQSITTRDWDVVLVYVGEAQRSAGKFELS